MGTNFTFVLFCLNLLIVSTVCAAIQPVQDKKDSNETSSPSGVDKDPLVNLGHISTEMLRTILEAGDEHFDMDQLIWTAITAVSKGAAILKYPEVYKDIQWPVQYEKINNIQGPVQDKKPNNLSQMVIEMKKTLDSTETKVFIMEERVALLEDELQNANNTIYELKDTGDKFVGFTAIANQSQSLSSGSIINFNKVLVNYGNAYNATTSVFRCPFKGIYALSANIEESGSSGFDAVAEILIGDTQQLLGDNFIFKLHVHDDSYDHDNSGGSAIVECAEGNHIRFKSSGYGSVGNSDQRSFFSVHLLKKLMN